MLEELLKRILLALISPLVKLSTFKSDSLRNWRRAWRLLCLLLSSRVSDLTKLVTATLSRSTCRKTEFYGFDRVDFGNTLRTASTLFTRRNCGKRVITIFGIKSKKNFYMHSAELAECETYGYGQQSPLLAINRMVVTTLSMMTIPNCWS